MVIDQNAYPDEGAGGGNGEKCLALDLELLLAPIAGPRRRGDEEHCAGPEDVEPRTFHVGSRSALEEEDRIGHGSRQDAEPE